MTHLDSQEHSIYAQVKEAEVTRRKQETVVDKLQGDLDALKRENAKRLKVCVLLLDSPTHVKDTMLWVYSVFCSVHFWCNL